MKRFNLYLMDMSNSSNTSGVDRYLESLLTGLKNSTCVKVYWIQLVHDNNALFYKRTSEKDYEKILIPLPQQSGEIISERYWIRKYNEHVFRLIRKLFENKTNCILHIHTLNLIDLAVYIKQQIGCKIITHLHCIPWKGLYNTNRRRFNYLYHLTTSRKDPLESKLFLTNNCEWQSYYDADHLVCVTESGKSFLTNIMEVFENKITVISNGIADCNEFLNREKGGERDKILRLIYVGVLSKSKGLSYILEAMRIVQRKGYDISLTIAGKYTPAQKYQFSIEYSDLSLNMMGRVSFEELKNHYQESDIGVIASLQEQASYVALEMAMFGLPIITTAVDGLDETFTEGLNALKVDTHFSKVLGLGVDVEMMAACLIELIDNMQLRKSLGKNARQLYEEKLKLDHMMEKTIEMYKRVGGFA